MADNPWKTVFKGDLIAVEKHETKGYEHAIRPPGVRLILTNAGGELLITKEYRSEISAHDYRLPGGKVFDDIDSWLAVRDNDAALRDAVMRAARLEAKQETGVDEITDPNIYAVSHAGASVEWDLYYVTGSIARMSEQELEDDEKERGIEVAFYAKDKVADLLRASGIQEDRTAGVLYRYLGL